ncbi:MAG: pilus assembly protein [bacterium]|nr:pilus assembly protein [bacterium]
MGPVRHWNASAAKSLLIDRNGTSPPLECERGEVTTTVLVVPIAMFLIFVVVQAALVFHAQAIVDAAAQDGAQAGQGETGTEEAVRTAVQSVIGTSAENLLANVEVFVDTGSSLSSVTVQATVKSLIPGYAPAVSSTASGPREIFMPESAR